MLVGGPKFLDTERYNIVAKAPNSGIGAPNRTGGRETPPPIGVALMMLRALLEDRFKLATHKEIQQATAYAFLPPKGELKLKKANPSDRAECKPDPGAVSNTGGLPMVAFTCQNTTIEELAKNVSQWAGAYIDHPAVDATGLQGAGTSRCPGHRARPWRMLPDPRMEQRAQPESLQIREVLPSSKRLRNSWD